MSYLTVRVVISVVKARDFAGVGLLLLSTNHCSSTSTIPTQRRRLLCEDVVEMKIRKVVDYVKWIDNIEKRLYKSLD